MKLLHLLVCSFWIMFMGTTVPLSAQQILPDSMITYQNMVKEALSAPSSITVIQNTPATLLEFLEPVKATFNEPSQSELNFLSYGYLAFMKSRSAHYDAALLAYDNGYQYLKQAKPYDKYLGYYYFLRGKILLETGDQKRGLQALADAEEVFLHQKNFLFLHRIYHSKSDFFYHHEDLIKAIEPLDKSIVLQAEHLNEKISSLIKRGQIFSKLDQYEKADADFGLAKKQLSNGDTKLSSTLNSALGEHLLRKGESTKALQLYDEALEQLCPGIRAEKFKAFKNCINPLAFLETLLLRGRMIDQSNTKRKNTASLKTGYNNYLTGVRYLQYLADKDPERFSKELFNSYLLDFLEKGIAICYLQDSLQQDTLLFFQNALNFSTYTKTTVKRNLKINKLQKLAHKENSDFLSFFYGKQAIYAFVINKEGKQFYKIPKDIDFDQQLTDLVALQHHPFQSIKEIKQFKEISFHIYQKLFQKLDLPNTNLCIIPDGKLAAIPFESLVVSLDQASDFPVNYLLFNKVISYAYHFKQLERDLNTPALDTRATFTFAPIDFKKHGLVPLKGTPGHIRFLEDKFQCKKWINEEATVSNFQEIWPSKAYNIVVFETHAAAGKSPSIYFYDKKLGVDQLPKMNANLAVLNNCNTHLSDNEKVKGGLYITKSLSKNGIPATVVPLWSVQQRRTIKVLEAFYLELASGMEKDKAMKLAKVNYLKSCGDDAIACSPHFWAGLIVTGNSQPLYQKSYLLPLIIIALIILLVFVWRRSQQEVG